MAAPVGISLASTPHSHDYAVVVTPSDSVNLAGPTTALWVGGAGTITAVMMNGDTCLFSGIPSGVVLPIRCTRVNATGTTATLIVAMY